MDKKILVVDDNELIIKFLSTLLRNEHYIVQVSCDGRDALGMMYSFKPDLVVLDLMMPAMNGIEVLKILDHNVELKNIPIIVLSAVVDEEIKQEVLSLGVRKYFNKPVTPAMLKKTLEEIFSEMNTPS